MITGTLAALAIAAVIAFLASGITKHFDPLALTIGLMWWPFMSFAIAEFCHIEGWLWQ
jgi:hypothetical protein